MRKLIAQISILYESGLYAPGEALPAHEAGMVEAWLKAGSAVWVDEGDKAESVLTLNPAEETETETAAQNIDVAALETEKRQEETFSTDEVEAGTAELGITDAPADPDQAVAGKVPKPGRPMKARKTEK